MSGLLDNNGRGALLSECGRYRYRLWRIWDDLAPMMVWVMLNPSTADADADDPTIRKCVGFARQHKHGGIIVANLFAWRATEPRELLSARDPVGPDNNHHIAWATGAPLLATVVAGWGRLPSRKFQERANQVEVLIRSRRTPHTFGVTQDGQPRHPLMLAYATPLIPLGSRRDGTRPEVLGRKGMGE